MMSSNITLIFVMTQKYSYPSKHLALGVQKNVIRLDLSSQLELIFTFSHASMEYKINHAIQHDVTI